MHANTYVLKMKGIRLGDSTIKEPFFDVSFFFSKYVSLSIIYWIAHIYTWANMQIQYTYAVKMLGRRGGSGIRICTCRC